MVEPEVVAQMVALQRMGWGSRRIARELGVARNTVKRYLAAGGYVAYGAPKRGRKLAGLEDWLRERFVQHRGNCDVVRQELLGCHGICVSLRTVERACRDFRAELEARSRATVRFETAPGRQLQIDFGEASVEIGGEKVRVHVFVATLGYSRLGYVAAFRHQRQWAWFAGLEGAFAHFGGVPQEVLVDNAKALVTSHDRHTREVVFNDRFRAFARHWGFTPKACAPFRARTKVKDENGVGYVKRNALAGHRFESCEALQAHLQRWQREVSDVRIHGTTGEAPRVRFERDERAALSPLEGRPPFEQVRELVRRVNSEGCVEVDTNHYSVPWRFIGSTVTVRIEGDELSISHAGKEVARRCVLRGTRQRSRDPRHFEGLVPLDDRRSEASAGADNGTVVPLSSALARPITEYEAVAGGGF